MAGTFADKAVQRECDAWEQLRADAFDDKKRGAITVVTAYFDASYNHPRAGRVEPLVYTVACYFATEENWDKSQREWRKELRKKGLGHFHMNKFEWARSEAIAGIELPEKNPYRGWSRADFDSFLDRLHRVINRKARGGVHRLGAFQTEVIRPDFDETRPDELKEDPECRSYYILCVANIMEAIARWADRNGYYDPIRYVFASGDREDGNLGRWFDYCRRHPSIRSHFRLGEDDARIPHDIQDAAKEPALQMADVAAYEFNKAVMRWVERGYRDMLKSELRRSLGSLARAHHYGWLFRKKELLETFAEMPALRKRFPV